LCSVLCSLSLLETHSVFLLYLVCFNATGCFTICRICSLLQAVLFAVLSIHCSKYKHSVCTFIAGVLYNVQSMWLVQASLSLSMLLIVCLTLYVVPNLLHCLFCVVCFVSLSVMFVMGFTVYVMYSLSHSLCFVYFVPKTYQMSKFLFRKQHQMFTPKISFLTRISLRATAMVVVVGLGMRYYLRVSAG